MVVVADGQRDTLAARLEAEATLTPRQAAIKATKSHLLSAGLHMAGLLLLGLPQVQFLFARLGWWLGPWRSFPLPHDFDSFNYEWFPPSFPWWLQLSLFSFSIIALTSAVLLAHGFAFLIVVQIHRWFDWPRYLREVRWSLNLRTSWATSARCSWWIWPAVLLEAIPKPL